MLPLAVVLNVLLFAVPPTLAEPAAIAPMSFWQQEYIEESSSFESITDCGIAIDADGNIHMAYGGMDLNYAWYDGSTWHYEIVSNEASH